MIEIKVNDKKTGVRIKGDTLSVVAELGTAICEIYSAIYRQSTDAASAFRAALKVLFDDDSLVWHPDRSHAEGIVMVWPKKEG